MTRHLRGFVAMLMLVTVSVVKGVCSNVVVDKLHYGLYGTTAWVVKDSDYLDMTEIIIPERITVNKVTYRVTALDNDCFSNCKSLKSITLPNSITMLRDRCLFGCTALTTINIPESVSTIGSGCFAYCTNLESITVSKDNKTFDSRDNCNAIIKTSTNDLVSGCKNTIIPNTVTELLPYCFYGLSVTNITIPNSVKTIYSYCFYKCSQLTGITIPSSLSRLDPGNFCYCPNLSSITVAEGNKVFDSRNNCNAIIRTADNILISGCKNTIIPDGVTELGGVCFAGNDLSSITIPESVNRLGEDCFTDNARLTSINIPDGVTSLGQFCFHSCTGLTNIVIPNSVTSIGWYCFGNCTGLTSVTLSNGVTTLPEYCFKGCSGLTRIVIPENVTKLDYGCFAACPSITSVTLPSTLKDLEPQCFNESRNLKEVTSFATIPPTIGDVGTFPERSSTTLYVYESNLETYKKADYWKNFGKILPISTSGIKTVSKGDIGMSVDNGTLTLSNVSENEPVSVYSTTGQLLGKGKGNISVDAQGAQMVIVKVGGKSYKVLVK